MLKTSLKFLAGFTIASIALAVPQNAQAAILSLTSILNGSQEFPPVVTSGTGSASLTFDTDTNLLSWNIGFSGLSTPLVAAHFHGNAPPGSNAPVQIDIGSISGLNSPLIGTATLTDTQETGLLADLWYINLHTVANPGGEIRGQVLVVGTPEPSSLGFLAMAGLSLLGYRWRKQS